MQTVFTDPAYPQRQGNCLQAVVASLLDIDLNEVPHVVQIDVDTDGAVNWLTYLRGWLLSRGIRLDTQAQPGELYIGAGPSPRGHGVHHAAIYRDADLVHDPHPDGTGVFEIRSRWALHPYPPVPLCGNYPAAG